MTHIATTGVGRCFGCHAFTAGQPIGLVGFACPDCVADVTSQLYAGQYPVEVYAARLAWLLGSRDHEFHVEDWNAGPLVLVRVGEHQIAYGGDAAEEGAIGVGVYDTDGEPVELDGITDDDQGWISGATWDGVRTAVRLIPSATA